MVKTKNFFNKRRTLTIIIISTISFLLYLSYSDYGIIDVIRSMSSWDSFWSLVKTKEFIFGMTTDSILKLFGFLWLTGDKKFAYKCAIPVYGICYKMYVISKEALEYLSLHQR